MRWYADLTLAELTGFQPLLASWERSDNPAQIRLRAYLEEIATKALPACSDSDQLWCELSVDVEREERLTRHYDLENYLTPLVLKLGWRRFVLAKATKRVGGGSVFRIGRASSVESGQAMAQVEAGAGAMSTAWKAGLRKQLVDLALAPARPGPVSMEVAFHVAPDRNWVQLWKPAGDAMGPILGEPNAGKSFHPNDDRIVELSLHRIIDTTCGWNVGIEISWSGRAGSVL